MKSLGLKVSLIVALLIAAIIAIIVYIVSMQSLQLVEDLTAKEAAAANVTFGKDMDRLQNEALANARLIAYSNDVIESIAGGDDAALKSALLLYGTEMDVVTVTDTEGNVLMRMHSDEKGDSIAGQKALSAALNTGRGISLIERGSTVGLTTRGSSPIYDPEGNLIGAVVSGHDLSNPKYVDYVKEHTDSEVTLFEGDTRLMSTIVNERGERVVGTQMANTEVLNTVLTQRSEYSLRITLFEKEYYAHYSPLIIENEVIGMLFTGVLIEEALSDQQSMMNTVLILGVACGLIGVVVVFFFCMFSVSRPLKKLGIIATKISSGDIGVTTSSNASTGIRSKDEVGRLARSLELAYDHLQGYVKEIRDRMHDLAEGDLTKESSYEFDGDFILIKDSINEITRNLNQTLREINSSSSQVSTGAKQVADGAQSLAQGSTEQAASVQQLSSSIAEIAKRTKENAETADKTSKLSASIKDSAEKGSRQMDDMITAVKEINDASHSISNIIKTIDDIAFQTNILALNAAVEAARAGQHGKGFAVVAEEVRNLASKSAEAAKNTGDMIQNSMEKAELGSRIAGETAESLNEIVSGINESTVLVTEIAESSEEQAIGISQINTGIDQVAQVVQQNSATAEESAAASEEMSGQSAMLQQLIAQFKLTEGNRYNLPSSPSFSSTIENDDEPTAIDASDDGFGKY